jgi:hypothetical protein
MIESKKNQQLQRRPPSLILLAVSLASSANRTGIAEEVL